MTRPAPEPQAPPTSAWFERFTGEVVRGRHILVHGNISDKVRWGKRFVSVHDGMTGVLKTFGYEVITLYDVVDGFRFASPEAETLFHRLTAAEPTAQGAGQAAGSPNASRPAYLANLGQSVDTAAAPTIRTPTEAFAAVRRLLRQTSTPAVVIVNLAELALNSPDRADSGDRRLLGTLVKAMTEAREIGTVRNLLILLADDLATAPSWLYRDRPYLQVIAVPRPSTDERRVFLWENRAKFHGAAGAADPDESIRVLANLSEGMAINELDGLWRTSALVQVRLDQPRELMQRVVFGQRQDHWRRVGERVGDAQEFLSGRVFGQEAAVARMARALRAATLGIDFQSDPYSAEARPKGVFFFVGPTGVGKTELARALSAFIFDDETAMARFDMSTFSEAHAAERLAGAPPGYIGHERGGELTNRVNQRPFSVLLFDEIEKAHAVVFDKFLQILDDGRLTDGLGRTAYFSQTLIIFTSNLGAAESYRWIEQKTIPSYEEVAAHFESKVRDHFTNKLGRPELLGRIGNGIIAFDILRPQVIATISGKFLHQLASSASRRGVRLTLDMPPILAEVEREITTGGGIALGARGIRDVLDRIVRDPLLDAIAAQPGAAQFAIGAARSGRKIVVTPSRDG